MSKLVTYALDSSRQANPNSKELQRRGLKPIPIPRTCDEVSGYSLDQRFTEVLNATGPKLSGAIQREFYELVNPTSIAVIVGALVVWVGSHAVFGAGFVVDFIAAVFFCVGVIATGAELTRAASEFIDFMRHAVYAQNKIGLDRASTHFANCISIVGIGVIMGLIFRKAKVPNRKSPSSAPPRSSVPAGGTPKGASRTNALPKSHVPVRPTSFTQNANRAGMVIEDARKIMEIAKREGVYILVRYTNKKSTPWLRQGFPAKPLQIKANTDATGFVVIRGVDKVKHTKEARSAGYYVVDDDMVPRNAAGQTLELGASPGWTVKPGQVVDPRSNPPRALVGDYDLMTIIGKNNTTQNISHTQAGNTTNPLMGRIRGMINQAIGRERCMHGAHDAFGSIDSAVAKSTDGVIAFMPDGSTRALDGEDAVKSFFNTTLGGRQTRTGSYKVPSWNQVNYVLRSQGDADYANVVDLFPNAPKTVSPANNFIYYGFPNKP